MASLGRHDRRGSPASGQWPEMSDGNTALALPGPHPAPSTPRGSSRPRGPPPPLPRGPSRGARVPVTPPRPVRPPAVHPAAPPPPLSYLPQVGPFQLLQVSTDPRASRRHPKKGVVVYSEAVLARAHRRPVVQVKRHVPTPGENKAYSVFLNTTVDWDCVRLSLTPRGTGPSHSL